MYFKSPPIKNLEEEEEKALRNSSLRLYRQNEEERRVTELEYQRLDNDRRAAENNRRNEEVALHVYERCDQMIQKLNERLIKPNLTEEERSELVAEKEDFKRRRVRSRL